MLRVCVVLAVCVVAALAITQQEIDQFFDSTVTDNENDFMVASDGVPSHDVGDFPNPDNPNTITPQDFRFTLYKNPTPADISCMPMGPIGVSKGGVAIFNPYDALGRDAVIFEVMDQCHGHPDQMGVYHYHQDPKCLHAEEPGVLIGAAFDGYPIYGYVDADGSIITTDDLDVCGGRFVNGEYRYHVTLDFPYIMGCFSGEPTPEIKARQDNPNCKFAFPEASQYDARQMNGSSASAPTMLLAMLCATVAAWLLK